MRTLTAAVFATAAVAMVAAGIAVSTPVDIAVRAEVAVARAGHPLDVRRIRIVDGLQPGESYHLTTLGVRNHRGSRTAYRLVASAAGRAGLRDPGRWLRFVPVSVAIDAGRSRAVGVRLELPEDAEPGEYAVVLNVRPGGSDGARLTFWIEPAKSHREWFERSANVAVWALPALVGAVLVVALARGAISKPSLQPTDER